MKLNYFYVGLCKPYFHIIQHMILPHCLIANWFFIACIICNWLFELFNCVEIEEYEENVVDS